jgi:hypothetical protein
MARGDARTRCAWIKATAEQVKDRLDPNKVRLSRRGLEQARACLSDLRDAFVAARKECRD